MKFKTNLVIGAVFAALLAFVYFHEIKGGEERRKEAERARKLLLFKDAEVERLALVRGDTTIAIERSEEGWRLRAPVEDRADADAVERYLRNIREAEREKVVVDSAEAAAPEVAARYGFEAPRLKVLIETEDGALDTLLFGNDTPTERYTYARQSGANPEIFVVRAWRFDNLDKGVFALRDRRVLAFDKGEVVEARRRGEAGELHLVKEDGQWQLRAPVEARADQGAVDGLLGKIESSEVERFVAEAAAADTLVGAYGLGDQAALEWSLLLGEDRAEKRLRIGRADGEGHYYARDLSRPQVFLVDSTLVQKLSQSAGELRDKKPLHIDVDEIARVEMKRAGQLVFAADRDTSGTWSISAPQARAAKSWKLNGLLADLNQLEATAFAAARADSAVLEIDLFAGEERRHAIRFARRDGGLYLQQEGDASAYRIAADDFAEIDLQLDDVAEKEEKAASDSTAADGE